MTEWAEIERDVRIISEDGVRNVRRVVRNITRQTCGYCDEDGHNADNCGVVIGQIRYAKQDLEVALEGGMFVAYGI